MKRWKPPVDTTRKEQLLLKRLTRTKKLFAFRRLHRHELFNDQFQAELEGMYRSTGAGCEPLPPAVMCMISLLQAYTDTSDAEAVELTVVDARWQMVLDCMNAESPLVSQGALPTFRARLIGAGLDRRLLERTVEDTINLLGHAARKIVDLAAKATKLPVETIAKQAHIPLALSSSTKTALDCDWSVPEQRNDALVALVAQLGSLDEWLDRMQLAEDDIIASYVDAVQQVLAQDTEQDDKGRIRIIRGVAEDRRVSIEDPEMRHGRKSKSKRFNGYKQHVATDLDTA